MFWVQIYCIYLLFDFNTIFLVDKIELPLFQFTVVTHSSDGFENLILFLFNIRERPTKESSTICEHNIPLGICLFKNKYEM